MIQDLVLVTSSPLAKIFQKRFKVRDADGVETVVQLEELLDDKERIWKQETFSVPFRTVAGDIIFWSGVPNIIRDQDKIALLSGGRGGISGHETDATGIVKLPIDQDVLSGVFALMGGGNNTDIKREVARALEKAKELSHQRCLQAARRVYGKMMNQRQLMAEADSKARFTPSTTEILCAYVLEKEAVSDVMRKKRSVDDFEATLSRIEAGVLA
jgi:hypothetical protein